MCIEISNHLSMIFRSLSNRFFFFFLVGICLFIVSVIQCASRGRGEKERKKEMKRRKEKKKSCDDLYSKDEYAAIVSLTNIGTLFRQH